MRRSRSSIVAATAVGALVLGLAGAAPAAVVHEGDLDTSFSADGVATVGFGTGSDSGHEVVIQPDGKIVVIGEGTAASTHGVAVARYRVNGTLDPTFSGDGKVVTAVGPQQDAGTGVALQPDGKIVVVGFAQTATYDRMIVVRYRPNGTLDPTFSGDGKVITDWGFSSDGYAIALQPDGKIVVGGYVDPSPTETAGAMVRYRANGTLDPTFSGDGKLVVQLSNANDSQFDAVVVQPDGAILVGGYAKVGTDYLMALARRTATGTPDTTFGAGTGRVITPIGTNDVIKAIALQGDGRIVVNGYVDETGTRHPFVARYLPGGALDPSFGDGGTTLVSGIGLFSDDLALQPNNKIVITGDVSNNEIALARLNTDGSLDGAFNGDGVAAAPPLNTSAGAEAVAIQRNGNVVAVGVTQNPGTVDFAIWRFVGDRTAPYDGHVIGLHRWSTTLRPSYFWQVSDDNTGVRSYDVARRVAKATASSYGAFSLIKSKTSLTGGTLVGSSGKTFCVTVRGRDWAGNVGGFGSESCMAFPVDDRDLSKSGSWTNLNGTAFYLGTARGSTDKGATLSIAGVDYRHLAIVARTCPSCGSVKVLLGKTALDTVSLHSAKSHKHVVIPVDASLAVRSGTVRIKVAGTKAVVIDGLGVSLA